MGGWGGGGGGFIKANQNEAYPAMNNAQGDLRVRVGSESDIDNAIWQGGRKSANVVCHKGEIDCVQNALMGILCKY